MVVEVEPAVKSAGAGGVAAVDAHVGPFVEQGAVEAFDFAVPLGAAWWEATVPCAGGVDGGGEGVGAVTGAVVGLDGLDADVELGEPGMRSLPESDRGDGFLVIEDFAVGDAAVTVDRGVDERVTDTGVAMVAVVTASVRSPAAAGRDAPQFLDVDLDEFAGTVVLDPSPDHGSGRPVHPRDPIETATAQDPMNRRGGQLENARDARRSQLAGLTQPLDLVLDVARGAGGHRTRPARAVHQTAIAFASPPSPPLVRGLARDPELVGDVRDRAALLDPCDQQTSTMQVQSGVTVHQSLPESGDCCGSTTLSRRLSSMVDHRPVNNVRDQDN